MGRVGRTRTDASLPRRIITEGVLRIAGSLDITAIAEGIETDEEYTGLRLMGVRYFQGYLYVRPGFKPRPQRRCPKSATPPLRNSGARQNDEYTERSRPDRCQNVMRLVLTSISRAQETAMTLVKVSDLRVVERLPGWRGRFFHSPNMTFAHYEFDQGASIHEHFHSEEEVYEVIEGELELIVEGAIYVAKPGHVAVVAANAPHAVRALTDGLVIIIDHPSRPELG